MTFKKALVALTLVGSLTLVGCGGAEKTDSTSTAATSTEKTDVKGGVAKMLTQTADVKKQLDAGDEAKIKEAAEQLEKTWATFEDDVKPKYAESYEAVETYLDPLEAGVEKSPLDKQAVGKLNDQLTEALKKLEQEAK